MALIYANAVNKRIHGAQPCRKKSADCAQRSPSSHRLTSRDSTPRKKRCGASFSLSARSSFCSHQTRLESELKRPVHRSRTSAADLLTKLEDGHAITSRKISTPVMSQSATTDAISQNKDCKCGESDRLLAKRSLPPMPASARARFQESDSEESTLMKKNSDEDTLRKKSHHKNHINKNSDSDLSDEDSHHRKHKESMFEKVKRKISTMKI